MGGKIDLSGLPEGISKIYWQALCCLDKVEDPKVSRALVHVLREVEREAAARGPTEVT